MDEIVCPHCRVKIPVKDGEVSPDDEIMECPSCGMLVDTKELARRKEEQVVESEWTFTQEKRRREVNMTLFLLLLGAIIAGITVYVFWILNRYK